LTCCKKEKCDEKDVADFTFTPGDRAIIPYMGKEILTFKNVSGDSIVCKNGVRKITTNIDYQYTQHEADGMNGCRGDLITFESNEVDFYSGSGFRYINIAISNTCNFAFQVSGKYISFILNPADSVRSFFQGGFSFSNDTLFNLANDPFNSIVAFHDHISIGPKSFSKVYELYSSNLDPEYNEYYETAFYSTIDGLVGLRTNYGRLWYLDQKR
jgi:hypothetical protein